MTGATSSVRARGASGRPTEETAFETLQVLGDGVLRTLDQTRLPFEEVWIELRSAQDCLRAIQDMQVRGAPLIGVVGAFGLAFALRQAADDQALEGALRTLSSARPTAVNLRWALERVAGDLAQVSEGERASRVWQRACVLAEEDRRINRQLGEHGARCLGELGNAGAGRPLQVLTHCNAGALATVAHGTALSPVLRLHESGRPLHIWVDETRPRNQGASLTAWELQRAGVDCTVIADSAAGELMRTGRVDAVVVGCDRVARNGDVANKVGTYLKALAARDCGVGFYVAMPLSTFDPTLASGAEIPIEYRDPREVTHVAGRLESGVRGTVQLVPDGVRALNPAFDITPVRLVTGFITEHGVFPTDPAGLERLRARVACDG